MLERDIPLEAARHTAEQLNRDPAGGCRILFNRCAEFVFLEGVIFGRQRHDT